MSAFDATLFWQLVDHGACIAESRKAIEFFTSRLNEHGDMNLAWRQCPAHWRAWYVSQVVFKPLWRRTGDLDFWRGVRRYGDTIAVGSLAWDPLNEGFTEFPL